MKADSNSRTGRIGVAGTQLAFERLGWIFREQSIEDYGIDAHVEVVENNKATGKLIALQIKSGGSWFREKVIDGFVFRGKAEHLEYWQQHSLPVIVVLYSDDEKIAYWQVVNKNSVKKTNKAWRLIVPFEQKVDASSIKEIQEFSKKLSSVNDYTILSLQDVSHAGAKRYSADVLLSKEYTKSDISRIAREITVELKTREYYRNGQVKQHWKGKKAQVIWLFLYLSLDDVSSANWICRTQWISKDLLPEFSPVRLDGECLDDEIIADWNKNYREFAAFLDSHKVTKEDYLDGIEITLNAIKIIVEQAIELTSNLNQSQTSEDQYLACMSQLEPDAEKLYLRATSIGSAPAECSDVSQRFQCVMAMAHNIFLPFSERGLEIWESSNRNYLVNQAIKDYQKDLLRLEFELEKVR